jgi:dienelactone hydrolase
MIKINGTIDAYIAKADPPTSKAVVISTDIFGLQIPNSRLLADAYASGGLTTIVPDLFDGKGATPEDMAAGKFDINAFIGAHPQESVMPKLRVITRREVLCVSHIIAVVSRRLRLRR